jgi:hypothetical protein
MMKALTLVWLLCLAAAVLVGVPGRYTHHAAWAPARALFVPCGVAVIIHAGIIWREKRGLAAWMAGGGLACIGVGLHVLISGPWTLLALPALAAAALRQLLAMWRGPRDPWFSRLMAGRQARARAGSSERRVHRQTYLLASGMFVLLGVGAVMAIAAA